MIQVKNNVPFVVGVDLRTYVRCIVVVKQGSLENLLLYGSSGSKILLLLLYFFFFGWEKIDQFLLLLFFTSMNDPP